MKKLVTVSVVSMTMLLSGCAGGPPETPVEENCLKSLRYEVENNVTGTTDEWLAYEMDTTIELVETETYDDGAAYTFEGVATLTADGYPTKSVAFTCFGNDRDDSKAGGVIQTINGECTKSRKDGGHCD